MPTFRLKSSQQFTMVVYRPQRQRFTRLPVATMLGANKRRYFIMRRFLFALILVAPFVLLDRAYASVVVDIDRGDQTMSVHVDGMPRYHWRVSTARRGYVTPPGSYHPQMLARTWYSKRYYNSPMPHSIFFYRGYAIHGTYEISRLGGPASHGCVRLDPDHAAVLYDLVEREGMRATTIVIH
jgi:lipoprotein-anchoring transpeptidase ErfK/SrfK